MALKTLNLVFQRINIAIFFIVIFTPCVWMLCGQKTVFSFTEKRLLATFPSFPANLPQVQRFFSGVDSYLNDHFGFREWMVFRYQRELRKRFEDTNLITMVQKGTNDWYFFTGGKTLENFTGRHLLSTDDLNEWVETYQAKRRWLEEQGIRYLFIVPPNKTTVYGEFLGEPWVSQKGRTRLSQIKGALEKSDKSSFLDLTWTFVGKWHDEDLFFKSDTHWNYYGAYLGYLTIAEKIEALFPGSHLKRDFTFSKTVTRKCEKKKNNCGDLTNMILDYDSFVESFRVVDDFPHCAVDQTYNYNFSNLNTKRPEFYLAKSCQSKELRALVFRDSFFTALEPYFSENFKEVIYLWKSYDQKNVEELLTVFKPDIVIEEKGEREL